MKRAKWPAETVRMYSVKRLIPYARNARTHSREQVAQVAASIKEWGWTVPILVDEENMIIAGHCRVLAAEKLGIDEIPVMIAEGWSPAQRKAYVIADNKLAENAGWDDDLLRVELEDLFEEGFDLELTGFSLGEINDILDTGDLSGEDDVAPPVPDNPVSRLGDIWLLGRHRLACGDSTSADVVQELLDGASPGLMVTDPPYGVSYDPAWRNEKLNKSSERVGRVLNDDRVDWTPAWKLFPGDVAYVWHTPRSASEVSQSIINSQFEIRSQIIWKKPRFAFSRGHYHWQHETCIYAVKPDDLPLEDKDDLIRSLQAIIENDDYSSEHDGAWYVVRKNSKACWSGDRRQSTVWEIPVTDDGDKTHHGTQKPLECMGRAIRNHEIDEVYEPFCGSGTTLIACEILGRTCYAIELDPGYVDVAIERWQNRTGESAIHADADLSFEDVKATRLD